MEKRLQKLYEVVENDLLGGLTSSDAYIAPFRVRPDFALFSCG